MEASFFCASVFVEAKWVMCPDAPVLRCLAKRMVPSLTDAALWQHSDELVCIDAEHIAGVHLGIQIGTSFHVLSPEY